MSWSISVSASDHETARQAFARAVRDQVYTPKDGRLEAAADQLLFRMAAGRAVITSNGHLNSDGAGTASVSVNVQADR